MSSAVDRARNLAAASVKDVVNARAETMVSQQRQLLTKFASLGIAGEPMLKELVKIAITEVDERSRATLDAVKRAATDAGLQYSRTLAEMLRDMFDDLFENQARIVESQMVHLIKELPLPNVVGAIESSAVEVVRQRVLRANGMATTEIAHYVEARRTSRGESLRTGFGRAGWLVGGSFLTKAFDLLYGRFHH